VLVVGEEEGERGVKGGGVKKKRKEEYVVGRFPSACYNCAVHRLGRGFRLGARAGQRAAVFMRSLPAYVQTIEKRQAFKIGCPNKPAYRHDFSYVRLEKSTSASPGQLASLRDRRLS